MPANKTANRKRNNKKNATKVGSLMSSGLRFSRFQFLALVFLFALVGGYVLFRSFAATPTTRVAVDAPVVGITLASGDDGYVLATSDGGVFAEGSAKFEGSLPGLNDKVSDIVGIAEQLNSSGNPTNTGYWLLGADGGVYSFGTAPYLGGGNDVGATGHFVGIAANSKGGYWLLDSTNQVYTYTVNHAATAYCPGKYGDPVGIAQTPAGNGYWIVSNNGYYVPCGDAASPSLPKVPTNLVGATAGAPGQGFVLVGSDGGAFGVGATFYGSMGGQAINAPMIGIVHTADYGGYWEAGSDGGVFAFGDAKFSGAVAYTPPATPNTTTTPSSATLTPKLTQQTPLPTCPTGQTGTPPDCVTPKTPCPTGQTGTPPKCVTPSIVTISAESFDYTYSVVKHPGFGSGISVVTDVGYLGPNYQEALKKSGIQAAPSGSFNWVTCTTQATTSVPTYVVYTCTNGAKSGSVSP